MVYVKRSIRINRIMAKLIYNNIIPFQGYQAMTFFPFIFARKRFRPLSDVIINHESIRLNQQFEMLVVSAIICLALVLYFDLFWLWMILPLCVYYLWYCIEYVIRLFLYGNRKEAYHNIATEQEAFQNESDFNYLAKDRKPFAWVKYLGRKTYRR